MKILSLASQSVESCLSKSYPVLSLASQSLTQTPQSSKPTKSLELQRKEEKGREVIYNCSKAPIRRQEDDNIGHPALNHQANIVWWQVLLRRGGSFILKVLFEELPMSKSPSKNNHQCKEQSNSTRSLDENQIESQILDHQIAKPNPKQHLLKSRENQ